MTEVLLNSKCPNCGSAFDPDYIFGNLRMCRACKQWSVALANNTFNENVMFRIIHFEIDSQQIRKDLCDFLLNECSLGFLKKITDVTIEKLLIPVREIGSGNDRKIIPLNSNYSGIVDDLVYKSSDTTVYNPRKSEGTVYDLFIPREKQKLFSGEDARSRDIKTEEIDVSKESVDFEYNIFRDEYYRIIYIPVYRIHLGGIDKTWACYGLKGVYGLKSAKSFLAVEKSREAKKNYKKRGLIATIGVLVGFKYGGDACSAIFNEPSSSLLLPFKALFFYALWTIVGLIIGLIISYAVFDLPLKLKKEKLLSRIFRDNADTLNE